MLQRLIRRFVPNHAQIEEPGVRAAYGVLAGGLGIAHNLLLFAVKLPVGLLTHSMAIVSDAFNNLSDMGSSLIALIGLRMSARKPDTEHPFGHGRLEYVSSLLVAMVIVVMGIELIRESIPGLTQPATNELPPPMAAIMGLSIGVKLWMVYYNRAIGRRIHSGVILAAAQDSLNDVVTTAAVLAAALIRPHTSIPVDALAGICVSLVILYSGYRIGKETIDQLLGGKPDPQLVQKIATMVLEQPGVVGLHDMIVHDYGAGRSMASVHAEVPDDIDIHAAHEMIDMIEQRIKRELGIQMVIHMDPIAVGNEQVDTVKRQLERAISAVDLRMSMHDFRMSQNGDEVDLMFDLVMPSGMDTEARAHAIDALTARMKAVDPRFRCIIQQDESFLNP